jgi:hypothetical protein
MNSRTTRRFRQLLSKLPDNVRRQAIGAYRLFRADPQHPGLHFKKVHPTLPVYSARVNDDYRVVGQIRSNGIVWFWVGKYEDYDRLLKTL